MTEAMPFLQKAILLSYEPTDLCCPRLCRQHKSAGLFLFHV